MGFTDKFYNKPLNPPAEQQLSQNPQPKLPQKKEHPFLFSGSQEHIKGRGGIEEDLIRILRTEPSKVAELNKRLRSYSLPPVYSRDASKIAKEIIERRFSSGSRADNKITKSEMESSWEKHKEYRKSLQLKKEKGYKEFRREQVMDKFFDDLLK